ncbi:MAG: DedA family protein [Rickettsiales bacterium]|nr:DedA family protein [Rickettsiales bacterium]
MNELSELILLFASALLAATLFPAQSEAVLVGLHLAGNHSVWSLFLVATVGNVLGSVINWLLGYYLIRFKDRKWFPIKGRMLDKATKFYQKYGVWTLLLAWTPFIGDPLTLVAGIFRTNIWLFLLLVTISKAGRYALLLAII